MNNFTDLELLSGWAKSLSEFANDEASSVSCWTTLRPNGPENDAIMRLGAPYPAVIRQLQDFLGYAEEQYEAFLRKEDDAKENFFQAVHELVERGESAVNAIESFADSADNKKIFPHGMPDDTNVVALAVAIHEEQNKPEKERRKNKQIARDFVGKTGINPDSLLRQVRRATK
jgi:hypothetical protein